MNLPAIAAYLELKRIGKRGKTLFVTEMPAECKEGVLLMDDNYGTPIDHELPNWYNTSFRLVIRSADYASGLKLALAASKELTIRQDVDIVGEMLVKTSLPVNKPRPYRRSQGGFWEFEVDMDIVYIEL